MIFKKPSTRTRVSFEVGMWQLGGYALSLSANDLQLGRGEAVAVTVLVTNDPGEAVAGPEVVYTDGWTSMGQEKEKTERINPFKPYRVNSSWARNAKEDYLFMHCLPAHRGEEVTDEIADSPNSVTLDRAENRMHMQKAILALVM